MILPEHEELIDAFKAMDEDDKHRAIVVATDQEAHRVIAAWPSVLKSFSWLNAGIKVPTEADPVAWDLLWRSTRIDMASVVHYSGVDRDRAVTVLGVLKGARLIYPDGSISKVAARILDRRLRRLTPKGKDE